MQFQPQSREEIEKKRGLLNPGECEFKVRSAAEETSSAGNPMVHLTLQLWDAKGNEGFAHDYLLESVAHKLRNFCYACGLGHLYENGALDADDCAGRSGRCKIRREEDKTGKYAPKNTVADYLPAAADGPNKPAAPARENKPDRPPLGDAYRAAVGNAKRTFATLFPDLPKDELAGRWAGMVKAYFHGRPEGTIGIAEWNAFVADGFERPAASPPFGDEPQFKEDDIPF